MKPRFETVSSRRGLSLMEVLFAIGVLMVGLLGIASVLPVGTRNAATALRSDAATSAIENQISNAVARFDSVPTLVDLPLPSKNAFYGSVAPGDFDPDSPNSGVVLGGLWSHKASTDLSTPLEHMRATSGYPLDSSHLFDRVSVSTAEQAFPNIDPIGGVAAPSSPIAFCVDPAFIAAANNLRPDSGNVDARVLNHYDRTKFPCFDVNYNSFSQPGLQMNTSLGWPMTPRMLRVPAISGTASTTVPNEAVANALLSERDGLPLTRSKDRTRSPSLFFRQVGASATQVDVQRTGNYSSIVMYVPLNSSGSEYEKTVVVYENRQLTTKKLGIDTTLASEVFPLVPFSGTAATDVWPLKKNTNFVASTYPEEVMGMVTRADTVISGGVGRFTFVHSNTCNPEIKLGQWLMLSRWDSSRTLNEYAWYRVSTVLTSPRAPVAGDLNILNSDVFVTEVEVKGKNWIFHPNQMTGGSYPVFPALPATGWTLVDRDNARNATYVLKAPRVVAVYTTSR